MEIQASEYGRGGGPLKLNAFRSTGPPYSGQPGHPPFRQTYQSNLRWFKMKTAVSTAEDSCNKY